MEGIRRATLHRLDVAMLAAKVVALLICSRATFVFVRATCNTQCLYLGIDESN